MTNTAFLTGTRRLRGRTARGEKRTLKKNSAENVLKRASDAKKPLHDSPVELTPGEQFYYDKLMVSRMWEEWTEAELVMAARLAKLQVKVTEMEDEVRNIPLLTKPKGSLHPSHVALNKLMAREILLLRGLKIAGTVKNSHRESAFAAGRELEQRERERWNEKQKRLAAQQGDELPADPESQEPEDEDENADDLLAG